MYIFFHPTYASQIHTRTSHTQISRDIITCHFMPSYVTHTHNPSHKRTLAFIAHTHYTHIHQHTHITYTTEPTWQRDQLPHSHAPLNHTHICANTHIHTSQSHTHTCTYTLHAPSLFLARSLACFLARAPARSLARALSLTNTHTHIET